MKATEIVFTSFRRLRWAYLLAAGLTGVTLLTRMTIGSWLEGPTMIVFAIPVILSAYWGGIGPGLLATLLSALGAAYFVLPPLFSFKIFSGTHRWQEGILLFTGGLISVICELLHRSRRRVETVLAELQYKESELRRREEAAAQLAAIVQSSDDAIIGKTLEGIVTSWNAAAEKVFGYPAAEMLGQPIMRLIPAERRQEEEEILGRVRRGESVLHFDTVRLRKDGSRVDVSITTSAIKDASGKIIGASKVARDITERRLAEAALREREEQLGLYVEHSPAAVAMFDRDMKYLIVSRRWLDAYGLSGQSIIDRSHYEVFPEVPERWKEIHRRCLAGAVEKCYEDPFPRADGTTNWIHWEVRPWHRADGSVGGIIIFSEDITERKQVEEALRDSEERLNFALQTIHIGAWELSLQDKTAKRTLIHDRIFGYDTLLPVWTYEMFLEHLLSEDRAEVDRKFREATEARANWNFECRIRRADGEVRWIWAAGGHELSPEGEAIRMSGIVQDITERKQMELAARESEERFRTMANSMAPLAWIARADGFISWYNVRWHEFTGTTPEEMEGWGWQSVHDPRMLPKVMENWKAAIASGKPFEMEFPLRGVDGKFRNFLTRGQPLKNSEGRVVQWFGTNTDVDELKQAEEKVRLLNAELEQRVIERTAQLETANRGLELAGQHKSEFLANMSHELRTPLNGIIGFSEFLYDEKPGPLKPKQKEYIGDVLNSARHLLQLINDVLDLAKVESGKMELYPETFSLQKAIEEVCAVTKGIAHKKQIALDITISAELEKVTLDQQKFKQVLYNLLSNAIKFTDSGGRVEIAASPRDRDRFHISVRDSGVGIKQQDLKRLFREFEQLDAGTARRFEGTGLGLALTKKILESQNGSIDVESELGKGSTFTAIFPITGRSAAKT